MENVGTREYVKGLCTLTRKLHISSVTKKKLFLLLLMIILLGKLFCQNDFVEETSIRIIYKSNYSIYNNFNIFKCIDSYTGNDVLEPSKPRYCNDSILERNVCADVNGTQVFLMIVIETSPDEFKKRNTIRETWGSVVQTDKSIRLIFLLGKGDNKSIQQEVTKESSIHHDIVQGDFVDSYKNLTVKSFLLLKWAYTFCKVAKFVAKVDTDIYLNVPHLLHKLKTTKFSRTVIGRKVYLSLPIRDTKSKWFTSLDVYPRFLYPTYIAGPAYVLSMDIIYPLINVCQDTIFPWEDIFITGICASRANANLYMDWTFAKEKRKPDKCSFRNAITGHGHSSTEMREIWNQSNDETIKCPVNLIDYWKKYLY